MKIIVILLTLIVLFLLYIICFITINKKETSKNTEQKEPQNHKNISKNNIEKNSTASTRSSKSTKNTSTRNTSRMKWRNKMLNISMIPKTVELDKNTLLPQSIKREYGYGRRFNTFVVADGDFFYHRSTCSKTKGKQKQLVHRYIALQKELPCPECNPNAQIDEWYMEFLKVNFGIDMNYNEFNYQLELSPIVFPETEVIQGIEE